jgi:FkbM family methyltransferase
MLTRDEVIWGYRYILGRDPESEAVINASSMAMNDYLQLRGELLKSQEFERINKSFMRSRWVAAPVFEGARLLWLDLSDVYVSLGCLQDAYEYPETNFVRGNLRAGNIFVDVGANIGWFTMLATTLVGDSGRVHAFEPRKSIAEKLQASVSINHLEKIVSVYGVGLSDENKEEILMWEQGTDNAGSASFAMDSKSATAVRETISVRRLDDISLPQVDFVKIDVEGAEMLALRGGQETLRRCRPVVLSEVLPSQLERVSRVSPDEYFAFFQGMNYRSFIIDEKDLGREVFRFPEDWHKELVNIAFIPNERDDVRIEGQS